MKNDLTCAVVRDLLPTVADGLASEETVAAVNAHTAGCAPCRAMLDGMKAPEPAADPAPQVDYLKKVRRRGWLKGLAVCLAMLLVAAGIAAAWLFGVGVQVDASWLMISGVQIGEDYFGQKVTVSGALTDSGRCVNRVTVKENGNVVTVKVYAVPALGRADGNFTHSVRLQGTADRVVIDGGRDQDLIMWDGVPISRTAAELYNARNPYVGDMAANARVAQALGITRYFGPYTSQLQTGTQPYSWELHLQDPPARVFQNDEQIVARAIALLAAVDNLDEVTLVCPYSDEKNSVHWLTVNVEGACAMTGMDIKAQMDTPAGVEELLTKLGINWTAWSGMPG